MRFGFLAPQQQTVGRPLAPLPIDPVFSGLTEPLSVSSVFRNRVYNIVEAQHSANIHPLGFQWYSHAYELNAASSNVSQM